MNVPQAYFNGQWLPASSVAIPLSDSGFVLGATITEQLRTFGGQLFRVPQHLARLQRSLEIVDIPLGSSLAELATVADDLARHNHALLDAGDDLGLAMLITPGPYATMADGQPPGPLVCLHTYNLPFHLWSEKYHSGVALVTTAVRQVPPACWSAELKCRSRMHYYLADKAAAAIEHGARALLLDEHGHVAETSTTNVVLYRRDAGLISPVQQGILHGISLQMLHELATKLGLPFIERDILPAEVALADEVLLTSTTSCILPAVRFNGQPIGAGRPGPIFQRLLAAWSAAVAVDIPAQATRISRRS